MDQSRAIQPDVEDRHVAWQDSPPLTRRVRRQLLRRRDGRGVLDIGTATQQAGHPVQLRKADHRRRRSRGIRSVPRRRPAARPRTGLTSAVPHVARQRPGLTPAASTNTDIPVGGHFLHWLKRGSAADERGLAMGPPRGRFAPYAHPTAPRWTKRRRTPKWVSLFTVPTPYGLVVTSEAPWAGYRDDDIGRRLTNLADQLASRLGDAASLRRDELFHGSWWLEPRNPHSVGVTWVDFGDELLRPRQITHHRHFRGQHHAHRDRSLRATRLPSPPAVDPLGRTPRVRAIQLTFIATFEPPTLRFTPAIGSVASPGLPGPSHAGQAASHPPAREARRTRA